MTLNSGSSSAANFPEPHFNTNWKLIFTVDGGPHPTVCSIMIQQSVSYEKNKYYFLHFSNKKLNKKQGLI
jgi:hypothetical protein